MSQQNWANRRSCHYVDDHIQGGLVAALLLFEIVLFTIAMLVLRYDLGQIIDEQLYRIHIGSQDGLPVLLKELLTIVPIIIAANVVLVACIDWVWSNYINRIIDPLRELLQRVLTLDLRAGVSRTIEHEVLDRADDWVQKERERHRELQQLVMGLDADTEAADASKRICEIRQVLSSR